MNTALFKDKKVIKIINKKYLNDKKFMLSAIAMHEYCLRFLGSEIKDKESYIYKSIVI